MTIAYYNGGVHVVDLSGLAGISLAGQQVVGEGMKEIGYYRIQGMDAWSAKTPEIAPTARSTCTRNDIARGLDVYEFNGAGATSATKGTWMGAAQAAAYFAGPAEGAGDARNALVCLLPPCGRRRVANGGTSGAAGSPCCIAIDRSGVPDRGARRSRRARRDIRPPPQRSRSAGAYRPLFENALELRVELVRRGRVGAHPVWWHYLASGLIGAALVGATRCRPSPRLAPSAGDRLACSTAPASR